MARISTRQRFPFRRTFLTRPITTTRTSSSSLTEAKKPGFSLFSQFETLLRNSCQSARHLFQIQALLVTSSLFRNHFLARTVLSRASRLCDVAYTLLIFRHINSSDTFCVNTVIHAYRDSDAPHQTVIFYFRSLMRGFFPNSHTFVPLVGSCAKMGCIDYGKKCHAQATKNGVDSVLPVQNSLIHMYACCGSVQLARVLFDGMLTRDLVSWNSIIDGHMMVGELNSAHRLFDEMPERNLVTWNVMISGYLKGRNPGYAMKLFRTMGGLGMRGNARTMVCLATACGRSGRLKEGRSVHGSIVRMFVRSSLIIDTALIDMYSKCRRVEAARRVFERMTERNLISWNAMILGSCIQGNPEDGLSLFGVMVGMDGNDREESLRLLPDEVTFIGILCACARAELLAEGRSYFKQMTEVFGLKPNYAHFWCMANLLANVGLADEAEEFLHSMAKFDGHTSCESFLWASLLGLCRFKRDVYLGERIAKLLVNLDPKNLVCYQFLLIIYAVSGQWENVSGVQKLIKERRLGIIPGSSLLDLKNIVHNFKVSNKVQEGIEEVNTIMDELARRFRLPSPDLSRS
ncbi:pentatricopeptide repeat-containing protein At3g51320 [Vigna radiata var. radiata]|uniref:Pentatricopeptide repeat-containing protein At3g51320 n=1 Tax=Vigna radiata var. radiata TaxID=3916 RepID=A0A1S3VQ13_VIGRR|nr:pentatricopeptide repeat-containing protein At3g51320 [Vigna radiata var. radiata]